MYVHVSTGYDVYAIRYEPSGRKDSLHLGPFTLLHGGGFLIACAAPVVFHDNARNNFRWYFMDFLNAPAGPSARANERDNARALSYERLILRGKYLARDTPANRIQTR